MLFKRVGQAALALVLLGLGLVATEAPAAAAGDVYGPYYLVNASTLGGTPQCLADPNASSADGAQQILWNCGSSGQRFSNETAVTTTDYWTFNSANGKCLSPLNTAVNSPIIQGACTTATSKRWAYHYVGGGGTLCQQIGSQMYCSTQVFQIENLYTHMCIATLNGAVTAGTKVVQVPCGNFAASYWWQFEI